MADNFSALFIPSKTGIECNWCFLSNFSSWREQIISKPLTQNSTDRENRIGIISNSPWIARYAPIGDRDSDIPKIK